MGKTILIFSDGTGQIGGLRPDQRLSNIYKMYRAMRSGPDSPIPPDKQFAFYDPGLGASETGGWNLQKMERILAAAIGSGIEENIIDCYEAIIANYEPGDRICLFGFSRGAYTVRAVANVMNLCGVPTQKDGAPLPRQGAKLRKIARYAVSFVYHYGAGKDRQLYEYEREEKARRFRAKYKCEATGSGGQGQGNVQPDFIGVFDTVAALGMRKMQYALLIVCPILFGLNFWGWVAHWPSWLILALAAPLIWLIYAGGGVIRSQLKYFKSDPDGKITVWHFASWNLKHYDRFLDDQVRFARHALSIDENRKSFPRVPWGSAAYAKKNAHLKPAWLKQVWFAGNHSDIGGSYPEHESRLSDIALEWMVEELKETMPEVQIRDELLYLYPDAGALQHDEIVKAREKLKFVTWRREPRKINPQATLHPSVLERFAAEHVPYLEATKPYRPENLREHHKVRQYYD